MRATMTLFKGAALALSAAFLETLLSPLRNALAVISLLEQSPIGEAFRRELSGLARPARGGLLPGADAISSITLLGHVERGLRVLCHEALGSPGVLLEAESVTLERKVDYCPQAGGPSTPITIRVEAPRQDSDGWSSVLEVVGFHVPYRQRCHGVDSLSAVQAAVRAAPDALRSFASPGTLTWLGEADLGLSIT